MRLLTTLLVVAVVLALGCGLAFAAYLFLVPSGGSVSVPPTLVLPPAPDAPPTQPALMPVDPAAAATLQAAPATAAPTTGPFAGLYRGTLTSDDGSSAPATLELSQAGATVSGRLTLDPGLSVSAGNCGATAVPAGTQSASGSVDSTDPNRVVAAAAFSVQGIGINATLDMRLDPASGALSAQAVVDLPFLCGRDPVISGVLYR